MFKLSAFGCFRTVPDIFSLSGSGLDFSFLHFFASRQRNGAPAVGNCTPLPGKEERPMQVANLLLAYFEK